MQQSKVNTNLSVLKDSYSSDHQALFSSYALNKFSLVFEELKVKYEDVEDVIKAIMEYDKTITRNNFPITVFYDFYILESDNCMLTFDSYDNKKKVQINYYFHNYQEAQEIFDIIQSFRDEDDELFLSISSYYIDAQGKLNYSTSKKVASAFDYNSLDYYPYLNTNEMFKQYTMSDSNILVLSGTPGTGKTKLGDAFMRYLLYSTAPEMKESRETLTPLDGEYDEIDIVTKESEGIKVAYIKNEDILSMDLFWNMLTEEEYHLVFLDDLDYSLLPRTQNISTSEDIQKNKFISNLLSFTDGIFESGNKTKFIITTNKDVKDIDTAVLRKGRTFDILQLRELKHEEAGKIWLDNGLPVEQFNTEFSEAAVLQADLGTSINIAVKARDKKIEIEPYIKEEGISVYSKAKNPTKIGL
jgi:DNA polymerase III delta prime subunit